MFFSRSLKNQGIFGQALDSWEGAGKVSSGKSRFKRGDILFGKLRPYFHKVGVAPVDGICSTDILVCKPKLNKLGGYVISITSSDDFVSYTTLTSTGTKMPRTSWGLMACYKTVIPHGEILTIFNDIVVDEVKLIHSNIFESRSLAQTRDILLPKLMSGEIRVKDAEKMVGEVL